MTEHIHFHRRAEDECPEEPPAGMTQEQLDFFTEQTVRAVRKGIRNYRNSAVVGFIILAVGLLLVLMDASRAANDSRDAVVKSGQAVATEGCNRDYQDRVDFRSLLERLLRAAKQSKATPRQKAVATLFYTQQLKRFTLPDCRKSANLLTADPDVPIPVVAPYYPSASYAPTG